MKHILIIFILTFLISCNEKPVPAWDAQRQMEQDAWFQIELWNQIDALFSLVHQLHEGTGPDV